MDNKIESSETKTKNIVSSLIGWILGAILVLMGIVDIFSDPLSGIFFLLAGLVILPPVTKILKEKYNLALKRSFKIVGVVIFLILAGATGKDKETKIAPVVAENTTPIVAEQTPPTATPQTLEEKITGTINSTLGDQTNMKKPRVVSVEIEKYNASMLAEYGYRPGEEVNGPFIKINSSENLTTNLQKSTMNKEAAQVFQNIFSVDPTIADIIVWSYIPTSDKYGNNKDDVGIVYSMSRELYKKINWANFQYADLPSLLLSEHKLDDRNNYHESIKF